MIECQYSLKLTGNETTHCDLTPTLDQAEHDVEYFSADVMKNLSA